MAVLGNDSKIYTDLVNVLCCKHTRLDFNIYTRENDDIALNMTGSPINMGMSKPTIDLNINIYVDHHAVVDSPDDILQKVEERVGAMVHEIQGLFIQRLVQPFREQFIYKISYKIRLPGYVQFEEDLHQYALTQLDKEFREVLEEKISE